MAILSGLVFGSIHLEAKPKKGQIRYRIVTNKNAYKKVSRGQHIALKVTPPKKFGANEFIYVEIYNKTSRHLGQIDFDIFFSNNSWFDYSAHVNGDDILPGRSGLRKIKVSAKKGKFPIIRKVQVNNLKIYNADATQMIVNVYVDLIRM